jgi:dephospho-CoA kinase
MKVVGLTGGIATGKSEAAKIIRKLNIPVFDADAAVHDIYQNGIGAKHLRTLCPGAIEDDRVDRKKLSVLIALQPTLLKQIELIIHPLLRKAEIEFLSKAKLAKHKMVVIDSPLLIETGHHKDMDVTILIDALPETQRSRAMLRPGMTEEKFSMIMTKQMPSSEKRKYSGYIIENNGDLGELENKIQKIFQELV